MRRFLLLCACVLLHGCQPADPGRELQADYLQRLANGLESTVTPETPKLDDWRMPPRRERLSAIPELRVSLLELLIDLHRCPRLQQLIGERNNSLGKQMAPSHRLDYEGRLIVALTGCRRTLAGADDPEILASLDTLLAEKRQQLPAVFWNAFNAGGETEHYLRFAARPLAPQAGSDEAALLALEQLASLIESLPGQLPPPAERLDELFFALQASQAGPALITSLASLRATLDAGSRLLEERQHERPACPLGQPTPRGRLLQNLFVKYYAGQLQPYLAEAHQRGLRWSSALQRLARAPQVPAATRDYLLRLAGERDSLWSGFQMATRRHVRAWQDTLRACQLAPGQSGWQPGA